jgi:hypothetical protein
MMAWTKASLPMAKGVLPMLSRTDQVSSTECDRCPYLDHGVLVILRQGAPESGHLEKAHDGTRIRWALAEFPAPPPLTKTEDSNQLGLG